MDVRELGDDDVAAATSLWNEVGLSRAWNDPVTDFLDAVRAPASTVLGATIDDVLVGTAMVGFDGHRGWLYYVAVSPSVQRQGVGSALTRAGEAWLVQHGARKVQLMVRAGNAEARRFYDELGYEASTVTVLQKWMIPGASGT
ncbi:MAG: GNAT family acetyltransferase [Acidimicrobiales bacterium]